MEGHTHLTNTFNPSHPNARNIFENYKYVDLADDEKPHSDDWEFYKKWIKENVIGPPQATQWYTVEQLVAKNMVGIYKINQPQ